MTPVLEDPWPESPGEREIRLKEAIARIDSLTDLPSDVVAELRSRASVFIDCEYVPLPKNARPYGMQLGSKRWAVRNDHLDFVAASGPVAVALATLATAASPVSPAILAVTLLFSALGVSRKLGKKSTTLDADAFAVLMATKRLGSATARELQGALVDIRKYPVKKWSIETIEATLAKLKAVKLADGTVEAFVAQDAGGRWSPNGI